MANARQQDVWTAHAAQQMAVRAYEPEGFPGRLRPVLDAEPWESVLDFGCGTGLWRNLFRPGRYVGLDQNEAMIVGARQRWAGDDAEFVHCPGITDGALMPFGDGAFDVIFTSAVLQHNNATDKAALLREFRRVLKTGGRFIMFENTLGDFNPGTEDGFSYAQDGWRAVIEPHGFACVHQERDLHTFWAA